MRPMRSSWPPPPPAALRWRTWRRLPGRRSRRGGPGPGGPGPGGSGGPDDGFGERYVQVGTTFGGAGVIRGDLTPECGAAVTAVLEALGKRHGPEDGRTEGQRFRDALQQACELDRAGARLAQREHASRPG